jgi:hypothetical protein
LVPEIWNDNVDLAGIVSTLLAAPGQEFWEPTDRVLLAELERLCASEIDKGDFTRVRSVEPLAFALAIQGCGSIYMRCLERLLNGSYWGSAHAARKRDYYGSADIEEVRILRHWNESFRAGVMKAGDAPRTKEWVLLDDEKGRPHSTRAARSRLLAILEEQALALKNGGAEKLGRSVHEFVLASQEIRSSTNESSSIS